MRENAADSAETNLICGADGGNPVGNRYIPPIILDLNWYMVDELEIPERR